MEIAQLHCRSKPFFVRQGFGGRPLREFPPYQFFELAQADRVTAHREYCDWYRYWLLEQAAWRVPKAVTVSRWSAPRIRSSCSTLFRSSVSASV